MLGSVSLKGSPINHKHYMDMHEMARHRQVVRCCFYLYSIHSCMRCAGDRMSQLAAAISCYSDIIDRN